jgi:hypothetical protein
MEIPDAAPEDAPAACDVLRRSISELCSADHHDDPVILGRWLANKTPEIVASWIVNPGNSVLVAVESGTILAVGSRNRRGRNYTELCITRREVPWGESGALSRARNESAGTGEPEMHPSQYPNGPSLLPNRRVC